MATSSARAALHRIGSGSRPARLVDVLRRAVALVRPAPRAGRVVTLELPDSRAWSAVVGRGGATVRCAAGSVWVTREGDPEDRVLGPGQTFRSEAPGRLALLAMGRARAVVSGDLAARR